MIDSESFRTYVKGTVAGAIAGAAVGAAIGGSFRSRDRRQRRGRPWSRVGSSNGGQLRAGLAAERSLRRMEESMINGYARAELKGVDLAVGARRRA